MKAGFELTGGAAQRARAPPHANACVARANCF